MYINKYNMGISNFEGFTGFTGFGGSIIEGITGDASTTTTTGTNQHDHNNYSMSGHSHNMDNYLKTSELEGSLPAQYRINAETNKTAIDNANFAADIASTQATIASGAASNVTTAKNNADSAARSAREVADEVSTELINSATEFQLYINGKKTEYEAIIAALTTALTNAETTVSDIETLKLTGEGYVVDILADKTKANNLVDDIFALKETAVRHLSDISGEHDKVIQHRKDISGLHDICIEHEEQIRIIRDKMEIILNETNGAGKLVVSSAIDDGADLTQTGEVSQPFANIQEGFIEGMDDNTTQFLAGAYQRHEDNISKQAQERSLNRMGEFLQQSDDIAGQHFIDYLIHEKKGTVNDVFERQKQDNILKERLVQTKEYQMRIYDQYIKIGKVAVIAFALCVFFMFLNSKEFIGDGSKSVSIFLIVIITVIYVIREIIWLSLRDPINFDKTNQGHDRQYEHDISGNKYSGKNYDLGILSGTCVGSSCCEAGQIYNSAKNKCITSSTPEEYS